MGLSDGRTIASPLACYSAPGAQHVRRAAFGDYRQGPGIHWPAIDEDISVANLLAGQPSAESQSSLKDGLPAGPRRPAAGNGPGLNKFGIKDLAWGLCPNTGASFGFLSPHASSLVVRTMTHPRKRCRATPRWRGKWRIKKDRKSQR